MTITKKLCKVGGYEYEEEVAADALVLRFPISKEMKGQLITAGSLAYSIQNAFKLQAAEPARIKREEAEREVGGIDPYVLRKLRSEMDRVLARYNARNLAAAKAELARVKAFSKGDKVVFGENVQGLKGKSGVVIQVKKKVIIVECEGKHWKATPGLISKVEGS